MDPLKETLLGLVDEEYRAFQGKLLPGVESFLGVRLPALRKLAKRLAREEGAAFLKRGMGESFEETMLRGMVIGYLDTDTQTLLCLVDGFLPEIDNWSVCDSFCGGLKAVRRDREQVWRYLQPKLCSEREFTVRFAVVMLIDYYIDGEYLSRALAALDQICHPGYYAQMAVAWAVSICYARFPQETLRYLKGCALDDFTYQKALQKITELKGITPQEKETVRAMKRQ